MDIKEKRKYKHHWQKCMELLGNGKITEEQYDEMRAKHEIELEKRRKYKRGEPIHTFDELFEVLDKDGPVWMFDRPKTSAFVVSQQFNTIIHLLNGGIFRAVKKENKLKVGDKIKYYAENNEPVFEGEVADVKKDDYGFQNIDITIKVDKNA